FLTGLFNFLFLLRHIFHLHPLRAVNGLSFSYSAPFIPTIFLSSLAVTFVISIYIDIPGITEHWWKWKA
ncbi:MAG: hypothetical protein JRM98_04270, partial [Nitrososphaerota archaeon]|nr:hypothetical protein [Nitrososphaerota archaeon]